MLSGLLPCDLLLDVLFVGLSKQVEKTAREVVGVGVRVPQLIGDAIEEQVPGHIYFEFVFIFLLDRFASLPPLCVHV